MNGFRLDGKVVVITGGGGLMGREHALAIAGAGGVPVLWEINPLAAERVAGEVAEQTGVRSVCQAVDITAPEAVEAGLAETLARCGGVHGLINNAARDPKVGAGGLDEPSRLENFSLEAWHSDLAVGLTGAFLCARTIGAHMAASGRGGVIINISSDLGLIAPDQRLYRREGVPEASQPVKPVTYSVVKSGLIGLTRYLAVYWAEQGVRCNALAPGGIYNGQPDEFVARLARLIPMGRMARRDEYRAAIQFLASDASSYMTGAVLPMDGGRTCW